MWSIWYYPPGRARKFLESFGQRSGAESYGRKFQRLLGPTYRVVVAFEPIEVVPASLGQAIAL